MQAAWVPCHDGRSSVSCLPFFRRQHSARGESLVLAVESLEDRRLLAGVVDVVELSSGTVVLKGDALDNALTIQVAADGSWRLSAEDETSLRFLAEEYTELAWSTARPLVVRLRGGDDRLVMAGPTDEQGVAWSEPLLLQAAAGDDDIRLSHLSLTATLVIQTSAGNDIVQLTDVNSTSAGRIASGAQR